MNTVTRRWVIPMYPNETQSARLDELLMLHRWLYNACLEQRLLAAGFRPYEFTFKGRRRTGWRRVHEHRTYLSNYDQNREVTLLRKEDDRFGSMSRGASTETLIRLENAYKRFFKDPKAGAPKFASVDRWQSIDYASGGKDFKGNGWRIDWTGPSKGKVYLSDVGTIRFRGCDKPVSVRQVAVIKRDGRWYLQVVGDRLPKAQEGTRTLAIDMGVKTFVTGIYADGEVLEVPKVQPLNDAKHKLAKAQRDLARKKRGSKRYEKQKAVVAKLHSDVAKARKQIHNDASAKIARSCRHVVTETLKIQQMMRAGGAHKRGLNRHMADAGIGQFLTMLQYKVEERGGEFTVLETRGLAPTQTCHGCGVRVPKALSDRVHSCPECGTTCDRDLNACIVMLQHAAPQHAKRQMSLGL